MTYIATFYSHFGAMHFKKQCEARKMTARIMPVPRDLSSSCGTCVRYEGEQPCPSDTWSDEVEQAVEVTAQGYRLGVGGLCPAGRAADCAAARHKNRGI